MSNPRAACGPVKGFVWPGLVYAVVKVSYVLTICPCFDNLEYHIFDTGGLACHFITSVTIAVRFAHFQYISFKLNLVCYDQSKPFNVRPSLIYHSMCGPGQ